MGLWNLAVRWWLTFSLMAIAMVTALVAGLGEFIWRSDQTYLSWFILLIFFAASAHLGYKTTRRGADANIGVTKKSMELCTSLGLLGTMVGLILAITGTFAGLDVSNHASLKDALVSISTGVSTALITTLVGVVAAIGLQVQLMVVREKWGVK